MSIRFQLAKNTEPCTLAVIHYYGQEYNHRLDIDLDIKMVLHSRRKWCYIGFPAIHLSIVGQYMPKYRMVVLYRSYVSQECRARRGAVLHGGTLTHRRLAGLDATKLTHPSQVASRVRSTEVVPPAPPSAAANIDGHDVTRER